MRGWLRRVHPYTPELARLRALMLAAAEAPLPHGELNQPVYVIEEPGGELNHVAGGMATGSEEVSESPSPSDNLHAP